MDCYNDMVIWSDKQLQNRLDDFFSHYEHCLINERVLQDAMDSNPWERFAARRAATEIARERTSHQAQFCDMMMTQGMALAYRQIGFTINEAIDVAFEGVAPKLSNEVKDCIKKALLLRWSEQAHIKFRKDTPYPVSRPKSISKQDVAQKEAAATNTLYREQIKSLKEEIRKLKWEVEGVSK